MNSKVQRIDGVLTLVGSVTLPLLTTPKEVGDTIELNGMVFPIIAIEENVEWDRYREVRLAYTTLTYIITNVPEEE